MLLSAATGRAAELSVPGHCGAVAAFVLPPVAVDLDPVGVLHHGQAGDCGSVRSAHITSGLFITICSALRENFPLIGTIITSYEQGILSSPYFLLPHRGKASEGWRNTVKITGTVEDSGTKCLWLVSVQVL